MWIGQAGYCENYRVTTVARKGEPVTEHTSSESKSSSAMAPTMAVAAASSTTLPPRFLFPALSPMWRASRVPSSAQASRQAVTVVAHSSARRYASNSSNNNPDKPIVLEKPAKFNPPSHGTRLPRKQPRHYGGNTTEDERIAQKRREYPGTLPPEGSSAYKFIHNRNFHLAITLVCICCARGFREDQRRGRWLLLFAISLASVLTHTQGTLTILAITTIILNFTHTSPFRHLLPRASEFWSGPIEFIRTWWRVIQLHENDRNAKAIAHHTRTTDDVMKRLAYRKAHGLDKENPIKNWISSGDEEEESQEKRSADGDQSSVAPTEGQQAAVEGTEGQGRKKWFGIF